MVKEATVYTEVIAYILQTEIAARTYYSLAEAADLLAEASGSVKTLTRVIKLFDIIGDEELKQLENEAIETGTNRWKENGEPHVYKHNN